MRFPWQPQEYARTCAQCGTTWQVPRRARRRRGKLASTFSVVFAVTAEILTGGPGETIRATADSISEQNRLAEASRHCPKCDADHFTQRASRGEPQ
jgi:hypothetical protein